MAASPSAALVPITMGASGAATLALDDFLVTDAFFPPHAYLPPHVHERASFATMLEGSFDIAISRHTYACEPQSAVTEPAEERHDNRLGHAGAHVVVIQPDPAAIERLGPCGQWFGAVHHAPKTPVCAAAWRIARELRAPDGATPVAVEGLVLEMLALTTRRNWNTDGPAHLPAPRWLTRAREELHDRFLDPPRIRDLAAVAGVHPDHLARAFRLRFGAPIGSYLRRLRLDWAATRLESSAERISAIALRAGFADQSHFTRTFKRHTGLTPQAYRRTFGSPSVR
jgi:AraC family transcriptional regulator